MTNSYVEEFQSVSKGIRAASAPVSWGITESIELPRAYPYARVLDEIAQAGYAGTELGPYGFLPSIPAALYSELQRRNLTLCSAFVAIHLGDKGAMEAGINEVERTAKLLNEVGCQLIILSDAITDERSSVAGRSAEARKHSFTEKEWQTVKEAIGAVLAVCTKFGLRLAFHHHVGTHIETPEEIDHLLSLFSPSDLGLCLDTGHLVYGGGDPVVALEHYVDRIRCVHLKDINGTRLGEARSRRLDFYAAVRHGVFAPLGSGIIDFTQILALLRKRNFDGWVVVEQDILAGGRDAATPMNNAIAGRAFLRQLGV